MVFVQDHRAVAECWQEVLWFLVQGEETPNTGLPQGGLQVEAKVARSPHNSLFPRYPESR